MVRFKTVAGKAGGGTVSGGFPTPTQPVLTQDVEAEVARATEAAQHVARLRAMLHGDGSEDGDDDPSIPNLGVVRLTRQLSIRSTPSLICLAFSTRANLTKTSSNLCGLDTRSSCSSLHLVCGR